MESVIIQSNFPHRISLSQASQITGYHQDYLGLLCRLGKIQASKIGRNWYTTQSELSKFLNPEALAEEMGFVPESEESVMQSAASTLQDILQYQESSQKTAVDAVKAPTLAVDGVVAKVPVQPAMAPTIVENIVISEIDSLPIRVVKKPAMVQHHSLQSLITRTELEQLKQDVLQLSGFIDSVSTELEEHRRILNKHEQLLAGRKDLTTQYASNIDFGVERQPSAEQVVTISDVNVLPVTPRMLWIWPAAIIGMLLLVSAALLWAATPHPVDYAATIYHSSPQTEVIPQVAGESGAAGLSAVEQP